MVTDVSKEKMEGEKWKVELIRNLKSAKNNQLENLELKNAELQR